MANAKVPEDMSWEELLDAIEGALTVTEGTGKLPGVQHRRVRELVRRGRGIPNLVEGLDSLAYLDQTIERLEQRGRLTAEVLKARAWLRDTLQAVLGDGDYLDRQHALREEYREYREYRLAEQRIHAASSRGLFGR